MYAHYLTSIFDLLTSVVDVTVEVYTLSLKERTKLKGLLEVVSSSAEFETIPIRRHEDALLRRIYEGVPVKLDQADFEAPHFKTFLLLQAHFSRLQLGRGPGISPRESSGSTLGLR